MVASSSYCGAVFARPRSACQDYRSPGSAMFAGRVPGRQLVALGVRHRDRAGRTARSRWRDRASPRGVTAARDGAHCGHAALPVMSDGVCRVSATSCYVPRTLVFGSEVAHRGHGCGGAGMLSDDDLRAIIAEHAAMSADSPLRNERSLAMATELLQRRESGCAVHAGVVHGGEAEELRAG